MKVIDSISRVVGWASLVVLFALMMLTVADVFLRYAFASPITGTTELTEMMMALLCLSMAWCAVEGRHVSVSVVMERLKPRVGVVVDAITLIVSLGVFIILVWQGYVATMFSRSFDVRSSMLDIPESPFIALFSFGFAILCISMITIIIRTVAEAVKR